MSLRTRLTLAGGGAVFVALVIASVVVYLGVQSKLHDQIDASLVQSAENVGAKTVAAGGSVGTLSGAGRGSRSSSSVAGGKTPAPSPPPRATLRSDASGYFQVIPSLSGLYASTGRPPARGGNPVAIEPPPNGFVALATPDRRVASGTAPAYFRTVRYRGVSMRLYTMRLGSSGDGLVRTARPLTDANATLVRVRWLLIAVTLGGAVLAALLGWLAAAAVLRPISGLARAVGEVTSTRDLNTRIPVEGDDEIGSLARDFNTMLGALAESQRAQQQLIADASHELRTPLAAHRANVELLARADLPPERRGHVLAAAVRGIDQLSTLVGDLIQAARNGRSTDSRELIALDDVMAKAVERARAGSSRPRVDARLEPYSLKAAPSRVTRAIENVLDNAVKWSSPGDTISVTLERGEISIRDHGPGIDPSDLPHVFDRFYRAAAARGLPGSGLGLAIVRATVEDHGGSVSIANADGGGTIVLMRFDASAD